ncbi:ABC transporter ATP-binding protein/permease [Pseudomonadales bacterium]|jgi:ABC-type transport system involved in Fe-S cluster assembly fused permease/ATPase subunit|nr:ABC transporter ATP-binding protein/permease [Gammaproteobacteria bacterium]MDA7771741.1 ABC transporter ATP-binding protein/permease [Pseudomonadales bacterium]MDC0889482.1 ABC transporter ATP-binding protein/permease [bacterium]MDA7772615.1 ABC transporter ATP-binding protein/permease [Pseudomonadales bacterium]MDA8880275.1 ABC transporter ATP-binding protein/permease [Pseudomonadales bacterium]
MEFLAHDRKANDALSLEGGVQRSALQTILSVLPFLWPKNEVEIRTRVVIALGCLLIGRTANVYGPIVLRDLIDGLSALIPGTDGVDIAGAGLLGLVLLYGLTVMLPGLLTEIRAAVFTPVSEFAQRTIGIRAFEHLHQLSMRFHLDRHTGGLSRAIERGTRAMQQIVGLFAFNIGPTLFEIFVVCLYLGYGYPLKYVGVILVAIACYILFTLFFTEWRTKFRRKMVAEESRAMTIGVDSLLNFETVKYFGNEQYESKRYDHALKEYMGAAVKSQTTLGVLNGGQLLVRVCCQIAILVIAIDDYSNGMLTIGEVVMLNTFMLQLFIPLGFLGSSYRMIRQALVDMEFLFQLLDLEPEIRDKANATDLAVRDGEVQFTGVNFGYEPERSVLSDVSFTIAPGTTTAIVGPSGAGKSTLSRLLYRFYDVNAGKVAVDGNNVADVTQASLRSAVGIVPQDTVLFNDTIAYNIRYGRPDATEQEVFDAARLASIHEFILSLPKGYETRVGERGLKLSGGEKQRVAIARTVLKNPPVLVLDEATSALDIGTEREIQAALKEVSKNRTTMVIAHRLSTIVHADEILVMDKGSIVERGSHNELLALEGVYSVMWRRQKEAADEIEKLKKVLDEDELKALKTGVLIAE